MFVFVPSFMVVPVAQADGHVCYEITEVEEGDQYASTVIDYEQGLQKNGSPVNAARSVPSQGLSYEPGQSVSNFFSLGFGGWSPMAAPRIDGPGRSSYP